MADAGLPLDTAYLTAIWLETLFYGAPITLGSPAVSDVKLIQMVTPPPASPHIALSYT